MSALTGVQLLAVVIPMVEDGLQLTGATGLIQQVFSKKFALLRQLLVLLPELVFHLTELLQLPAQPERSEDGIFAGKGDERGAGKSFVDV